MEFLGIDIAHNIAILKNVSWVISILFLVGICLSIFGLYIVFQEQKKQLHKHFVQGNNKPTISPNKQRWELIRQMFIDRNPNSWRMAIIDADTMLEDMVTSLGYPGNTFGEKLKSMNRNHVPWLDAAWDVHILRNKLAHEGSRYPLNEREAYRAYKIYENILLNTGYLA